MTPYILVVDDNPDACTVLAAGLKDHNYMVKTAANGLQALRMLHQRPLPQVVILDLHMPVMDGFQLITELFLNERTRHIPIIAVSGVHDTSQALELPGVRFAFTKGRFTTADIVQTVEAMVHPSRVL